MSRSGYTDDWDDSWRSIYWRGAVASAIRGRRGQAFLQEVLAALDTLPSKRLIDGSLELNGEVCAMGAIGVRRGIVMSSINPNDHDTIAKTFAISKALARELMFENDEGGGYWRCDETPEQRWKRVRAWVVSQVR